MEPTTSPKLAPYIVAQDAPGLIRFIEKGIGGRLSFETKGPEGSVAHAELRIEDGYVMVGEKPAGRAAFPAMLHLYVGDSRAAFRRAVESGATAVREPVDAGDGLVRGGVRDAWGNEWWFSTPART
jgi:PhnB protein